MQRNGWQRYRGAYYYFVIANKAKGSMVKSQVVNGVALDKDGRAILNSATKAELAVLKKAQEFVEKYTLPLQTKSEKLQKCFDALMSSTYKELPVRKHNPHSEWARIEAHDLLFRKTGICFTYGAGFAYIANGIGFKSVKAVSSGGHGWTEVNGLVYDPKWSKHNSRIYGAHGYAAGINFAANRAYVTTIQPRTKALKGAPIKNGAPGKSGLTIASGKRYYYENGKMLKNAWKTVGNVRYYFKSNGMAATGTTKIKGSYYLFNGKGALLAGSNTRIISIGTEKYRVTKAGKAKAGWNDSRTCYFNATGRLLTGDEVVDGRFMAFSTTGTYDSARTQRLRNAAVIESDAAPLLGLLGEPKSKQYMPSCNIIVDADGAQLKGQDGILKYARCTVYTFVAENGMEYFMGVKGIE